MTRDEIKEVVFEEVAKALTIELGEVTEERLIEPDDYLSIHFHALYRLEEKVNMTIFVHQFLPKAAQPVSRLINSLVKTFEL